MTERPESNPETTSGAGASEEFSRSDVTSEFRQLGQNLKEVLQAAWESEERRKLQSEIETGLSELGRTVNQTVAEFKESPTGQRIQSEAEDLGSRIRRGELEADLREDLLTILRRVNTELEKAVSRQPSTGTEDRETGEN
jgi:hypothetical protein